jgi:hypothetical protein
MEGAPQNPVQGKARQVRILVDELQLQLKLPIRGTRLYLVRYLDLGSRL